MLLLWISGHVVFVSSYVSLTANDERSTEHTTLDMAKQKC